MKPRKLYYLFTYNLTVLITATKTSGFFDTSSNFKVYQILLVVALLIIIIVYMIILEH